MATSQQKVEMVAPLVVELAMEREDMEPVRPQIQKERMERFRDILLLRKLYCTVVEAEQDPAVAHPLTYAHLGYNNLSRLARDAGLI